MAIGDLIRVEIGRAAEGLGMPPGWIDRFDREELYVEFELRDASPQLLGIIGSWGDTLSDEGVLDMLREWNAKGRIELDPPDDPG